MDVNKANIDIYDKGHMHQFQPGPTHKIQQHPEKHQVLRRPPMKHLSNNHEGHPNPQKNSQEAVRLYDEKGHSFLSLKESQ